MPAYFSVWNNLEDAAWLDENAPGLASDIKALPWVRDGIADNERDGVQELVYMAAYHESVFSELMRKSWVADGLDHSETNAVYDLFWIADENNAAALQILDIPLGVNVFSAALGKSWVADGLDASETQTLQRLGWIANKDEEIALQVLDMPFLDIAEANDVSTLDTLRALDGALLAAIVDTQWVTDGIDDLENDAIDRIGNFRDEDLTLSLVGIGWMQDDIEQLEVKTIQEISYIAYDDAAVASSIIGLGWVQDGIEDIEFQAIDWVNNFSDMKVASSVVALGWVQDGIKEVESKTIQELSYIAYDDEELASSVINLAWVQDGIEDIEWQAIDWVNNFSDMKVASSVVALGWVQDGIKEIEVGTIEELSYIDYRDSGVASSAVNLSWVRDDITDLELQTIEEIRYLSGKDAAETRRILAMRFLQTLEPSDASAVKALSQLASFREADFRRVISHSTLTPGITDDWAKIVATLYGVSKYDSASIDTLLDPDKVTLEERVIDLPLAGEVTLAIIRTGPGAARSMDILEHAVRNVEEFMATPFPTGYVGYLFGDAVVPSFAGTNFGTHIASLAKYDVDDDSREAKYAGSHIAHEVAHYYWSGNADWIDEGAADFMASVSENARIGAPIEVTNPPCGYLHSIAELEALNISNEAGADSAFTCNYALGERLFIDLYRNVGEESFRQALQRLYLLSQMEEDETGNGNEVGIEEVKIAFMSDEYTENHALDLVTKRWYDGTEPYDTSAQDNDPVNRRFVTVNGGIDVAYLAATRGGPPARSFSAQAADDWVRIFLDYSYSVGSNTEVPLEIVTYFEDGFVFDRKYRAFTAEPRYIGGKWWLSVGVSPSKLWAPGKYEVYVYNEGRKVVELEYEVTE